nr:MAG TPA: Major capsid protein [Caudoviricetes sp.]
MADVTRNLGPSKNQSYTYDAIGHAEDISQILTNIDPEETLFYSKFGNTKPATELHFSWMTKGLSPAQDNAYKEMETYTFKPSGSIQGMSNNIQFFKKSGMITDAQQKVAKVYKNEHGSEIADMKYDAYVGLAKDIEYMLVNSEKKVDGSSTVAPRSGGVPFFMKRDLIDVTVSGTDGTVTTTTESNLKTGDIAYFIADTIPTGMKEGLYYYVRVDDSNTKKLTLFDTQKGAVENIASLQVKATTTGTNVKLVTNNVVSLAGKNTFTLDDINTVMEMAFKRGGKPTEAYMSSGKFKEFSKMVLATMTATRKGTDKNAKVYEVATSYQGAFGLVNANIHRLYPDTRVDILDLQYWDMRYFTKPHEVTGLDKDGSYQKFMLEAELGLQGTQPKASCSIVDIKR